MSTTAAAATPAFEHHDGGKEPSTTAATAGAPSTAEEQPITSAAESGGRNAGGGGGEDFAWETSKENVMPLKRGRKVDAIHDAYESGGGGGGLGCSSSARVLADLKRCDDARGGGCCVSHGRTRVCWGRRLTNVPCDAAATAVVHMSSGGHAATICCAGNDLHTNSDM